MDCSKVMQIAQAEEAVRANEYRKLANEARGLAEIEEKSELQNALGIQTLRSITHGINICREAERRYLQLDQRKQ